MTFTARLARPSLVIGAALMLGGCSLVNRSAAPDDNAITQQIQSKLFQDSTLKTRDIHVQTQKGVVTLTGSVASDTEKAAAEGLARQATGVTQVIDELTSTAPAPAATSEAPATPASSPPPTAEAAAPAPVRQRRHRPEKATAAKPSAGAATSTAAESAPAPAATPAPIVDQTAAPAAPPPPATVTVPSGTTVTVRMIDGIDSKVNQAGQTFAASLFSPVVAGDKIVFPAGSDAQVRLVSAADSGKFKGAAQLQVELVSLSLNGAAYNVESGYYTATGGSRGKRTAEAVGGGAALGAIIGAIAGGRKGAAIGAGAGAGTGAGVQGISGRSQVKIPSETKIDFTLKAPVTVTLSQ